MQRNPMLTVVIILFALSFAAGAFVAGSDFFVSGETAYEKGNYQTAFKKLSNDDSARAHFYLGNMYASGQGVPADKSKAVQHYLKAAEKGHPEAQFTVGVMSSKGEGMPKNKAVALQWYQKAADQGFSKAQFNLGIMYGTGDGVTKNVPEAYKWIKRAADSGDENARKALPNLPRQ